MGTRSLTKFYDEGEDKPFVTMYRQYDGYLSGHGQELVDFLVPRQRINGIGGQTAENAANGIGCLAAQVVAHFKGDEIGHIYLHGNEGTYGEDYIYEVRCAPKGEWHLTIYSAGWGEHKKKLLWKGNPKNFEIPTEED